MSENKYSLISKIIDFSVADNPAKVKDTVDQIMLDKIQSEVEFRKAEIAKQLFSDAIEGQEGDPDPEDEEGEDEYLDDEDLEELYSGEDEAEEESDDDVETEIEITDDELEDLFSSLEELEDLESLESEIGSEQEFDLEEK